MQNESRGTTHANPSLDGKRSRGRPNETWRRSVERELTDEKLNCNNLAKRAADRQNGGL